MTPGQGANFIQAEAASRLGLIQALGLIPHGARSAAFLLSTTASITNTRKPMHYIEIFMALYGIALLVVGYRRNQRKMMAAAGMALMVAGTHQ